MDVRPGGSAGVAVPKIVREMRQMPLVIIGSGFGNLKSLLVVTVLRVTLISMVA